MSRRGPAPVISGENVRHSSSTKPLWIRVRKARPSFGQHPPEPHLVQPAQGEGEIDFALPTVHHLRPIGEVGMGSQGLRGGHQHRGLFAAEQTKSRGKVATPAHDRQPWQAALASSKAPLLGIGLQYHRAVVFVPGGSGSDENHVACRSHREEGRPVGGTSQLPAAAADLDRSVERHHKVGPNAGSLLHLVGGFQLGSGVE